MRIEVGIADFTAVTNGIAADIAGAATDVMRETTLSAKQELRDQVVSAGLGARLGNTWRGDVYPKSGEAMNPAGYIHSNAPDIIDSFVRGAQIVPIGGARYLAIPTDAVPRAPGAGRASSTKRMTPEQVETAFNQDLIVRPGEDGHLLGFIDPNLSRFKRIKRPRGAGKSRLVLMFTFVATLRMPKLLDLDGPADHWASAFRDAFSRRIG